jgi:hypothetical protein
LADDYFKTPEEITDPRKINSAFADILKQLKATNDKISSSPLVDHLYTSDTWRITETEEGIVFQQYTGGAWVTQETITPTGISGGGTLVGSYIKATGLSPGDVHISDAANWNINKAEINQIRVITTSVDWDLWILQNDNGYATDDAIIPASKIMGNGNGSLTLESDFDYEDEDVSKEVHFYIVDNDPGGSSFTIIVRGRPLE